MECTMGLDEVFLNDQGRLSVEELSGSPVLGRSQQLGNCK